MKYHKLGVHGALFVLAASLLPDPHRSDQCHRNPRCHKESPKRLKPEYITRIGWNMKATNSMFQKIWKFLVLMPLLWMPVLGCIGGGRIEGELSGAYKTHRYVRIVGCLRPV